MDETFSHENKKIIVEILHSSLQINVKSNVKNKHET